MEAEYVAIPGYPGYEITAAGRVRSYRLRSGKLGTMPQQKCWNIDERGRKFVHLSRDCKSYRLRLSRLILLAFRGPCPDGMECCHEDGNETNDQLTNLRWDTRLENCADKLRQGTQPRGSQNGNSRLTEDVVVAIKAELAAGKAQIPTAKRFQISQSAISQIARGLTWQHVPWPKEHVCQVN